MLLLKQPPDPCWFRERERIMRCVVDRTGDSRADHDLVLVACGVHPQLCAYTVSRCAVLRRLPVSTVRVSGPRLTGSVSPLRICRRWRVWLPIVVSGRPRPKGQPILCVTCRMRASRVHSFQPHSFQKERCRDAGSQCNYYSCSTYADMRIVIKPKTILKSVRF